jgi:hypothetical protein
MRAGEVKGTHFGFSSVFCTNWSKADRDVGMRGPFWWGEAPERAKGLSEGFDVPIWSALLGRCACRAVALWEEIWMGRNRELYGVVPLGPNGSAGLSALCALTDFNIRHLCECV